jgi:benzoate-CoA ligase family protein
MLDALRFDESLNLFDYYLGDRIVEGSGSRTAIHWGERQYSYAEVHARSLALAAILAKHGVRRGERVIIALPDSPHWAWSIFGVFAAGAVVCMANPDAPPDQLAYLIEYTRATAVITLPNIAEALDAATGQDGPAQFEELLAVFVVADVATGGDLDVAVPSARAAGTTLGAEFIDLATALRAPSAAEAVTAFRRPRTHRDEPCMWLFTSGSTGKSKANIHCHRDFAYSTEHYAKATVGYQPNDITLSVSRLYFGYATGTNLFFPFALGAATALFSERPTPQVLLHNLIRYRPTVVTNVPTMLAKLLEFDFAEAAAGRPGLDLSSVRFSLSAGEALPEALLLRWQQRFASDIYDGIGSAEMFHIYASNRPGDVRPGSLGRAVAGYELKVLPDDASGYGANACAAGEIGVLWVRGDSVAQGYWLDRDKSFATFHGHACRTGDLFHMDEAGYLYFDGRADDLLKVGGLWLSPHEVEEHLMAHDSVQLAAVFGVEVEGLTRAVAHVVLRTPAADTAARDAAAASLIAFLRDRVVRYKVPKSILVVDDLPRNDRGKIDKKALRIAAMKEQG